MIARKCDRCGEMFTRFDCGKLNGDDIYTYHIYTSAELRRLVSPIDFKDSDLCPECYRELLEWFIEPNDDRLVVEMNNEERWVIRDRRKLNESS